MFAHSVTINIGHRLESMNWTQLYTAFTPEERDQVTQLILERIELRREQILNERIESLKSAKGRTLRERHELLHWAHFVGMRPSMSRATRTFYRSLFALILGTMSLTIWLIALTVHPSFGAPLVLLYALFLLLILIIKPYKPQKWIPIISPS